MMTKFPAGFEDRFPQLREKWLQIGRSTERVERPAVEAALTKMYAKAGKKKPSTVFILRSPMEVMLALALLRSKSAEISQEISAQIRAQIRAQISDQISDQIRALIGEVLSFWWWDFGQFDAWWCSYFDAAGELGFDTSALAGIFEFTAAAGWSVLFEDWAFISDHPVQIHRDEQNRLHCETGPALSYPDGFSVYAVHGVRVPADIIDQPESLTVERIEKETNSEIRRVMIERYGQARYLLDAGAEKIHEDDYGVLYRKEISGDEPIVMVKVVNSTVEADGSFKDYFLRVPPTMQRAKQAIAWTFGKEEHEYEPAIQT